METTFRKIELQSTADLTYLESNVRRAARQKIDRDLPPSAAPEGEDALRRRVEELVDEHIRNTFASAKHNVNINGMDPAELQPEEGEEFEPLDARLADRIRALEATKESLTEKVADLRRTAPAQAAQAFQDLFVRQSETLEKETKEQQEEAMREAEKARIDVGELRRWDEVQGTWERDTTGLVKLKSGLTETVARLERAQGVVGYLEGS